MHLYFYDYSYRRCCRYTVLGKVLVGHPQCVQLGRDEHAFSRNVVQTHYIIVHISLTMITHGTAHLKKTCVYLNQAVSNLDAGTPVHSVVPLQAGLPSHELLLCRQVVCTGGFTGAQLETGTVTQRHQQGEPYNNTEHLCCMAL